MKKSNVLLLNILFLLGTWCVANAQFVHPGITHKKSDLDRMKYMVEAQIDPWYSSYQEMVSDSKSSFNYNVQGNSSFTVLARDAPRTNYNAWNSDIRAAYYNAIRWHVTGDRRHADKAVEIFNAWNNLENVTSNGTDALSAGIGYIMIEAAEIIKSTYDGWSARDIQDFKDMLVYPGYSNRRAPSGNTTFYWKGYQGDPIRHGNQGLSGLRTVMAIGIFLDNEIIYDRVLRYIKGESHRSDDLPYPPGPNRSTSRSSVGTFSDTYNVDRGDSIEDYGYDEVMTNYIYENGQCQESARDHQHTAYGIGNLNSIAEMSWNQGDDLYGHANDRLLLGLEYNMRYNVSAVESFPDQRSPWEPTVASGEFVEGFDRTGRFFSKAISTTGRADIFNGVRPVFEMPIAHYVGRGFKTEDQAKWLMRARDRAIQESGFEDAGFSNDAIGWGALVARRVDNCYGDPVSGFDSNALPEYAMNVLPMTIEAENYDYSPVSGEDRTYNETTSDNRGRAYRTNEAVDIGNKTGGGHFVGWITDGEWLTYSVYVPETRNYDISVSYSGVRSTGEIKFEFSGEDKTGEVILPSTGDFQTWENHTVANGVRLSKGVQSMRILMSGVSSSFNLDNMTISESESSTVPPSEEGTIVHIRKRNATGFAIDGNRGGVNGQNVYLWQENEDNVNQQWIEVDRGNGFYSYQKQGTNFCIDGGANGERGQNVYLWQCSNNNRNQHWEKVDAGGGAFKLVKRNASDFAIDGGSAGSNGQNIGLYDSSSRSQNLQWFITPIGNVSAKNISEVAGSNTAIIYPNPVVSITTVENAANSNIVIYDMNGSLVYSAFISSDNETMDLSVLATGVYYARVEDQIGGVSVVKIVKQ